MREKVSMLLSIARAMQALEESEPPILHRDLKPSNVLLDESAALAVRTCTDCMQPAQSLCTCGQIAVLPSQTHTCVLHIALGHSFVLLKVPRCCAGHMLAPCRLQTASRFLVQMQADPSPGDCAGGNPKVADMGLARRWEPETAACLTGETGTYQVLPLLPFLLCGLQRLVLVLQHC